MEQKNVKTAVYSAETIFNETAEVPIDVDFTLPDYCPDISKILKCRAISRISSKGVNGRSVCVEGCVTITVIYADDDNALNSYEYQYPFSKNFDIGTDSDGAAIIANTKCEYINCRAVTGRKIDVHGAAGIYVKLTRRKHCEVISDIDDSGIELLRGSIPATVPMGSCDKYLIIEEEIELGSGQPDIRCIVRYDADASVRESKIMAGKSVVKGEMAVSILYCPESGSTQTVRAVIPFSQLLEIEGMNDNCSCESKVNIAFLEIKPRPTATGECRSLMLSAKLLVSSECYCNNDIDVILDAYSRKNEAEICKNEVCFNKIISNINESFNCKKNLDFTEGALSVISDLWCDVKTGSAKFMGDSLVVNGLITAYMIAFDSQGVPAFYERPVDFEYRYTLGDMGKNLMCTPDITVLSCNYTITSSGSMELRIDLNVNASVYKCSNIPLIVDIEVNENEPIKKKSHGAMTIYFASKGESVWDIARHYFADVQEVRQINGVSDDILSSDRMILVPTN